MKKIIYLLVAMGCCLFSLQSTVVFATNTSQQSDLSIFFDKDGQGKPKPKPDPKQDPKEDPKPKPKPAPKPDPKQRPLPQTGELLASLIFILMGMSLIIFVLGMFTMKKICGLDYREVV